MSGTASVDVTSLSDAHTSMSSASNVKGIVKDVHNITDAAVKGSMSNVEGKRASSDSTTTGSSDKPNSGDQSRSSTSVSDNSSVKSGLVRRFATWRKKIGGFVSGTDGCVNAKSVGDSADLGSSESSGWVALPYLFTVFKDTLIRLVNSSRGYLEDIVLALLRNYYEVSTGNQVRQVDELSRDMFKYVHLSNVVSDHCGIVPENFLTPGTTYILGLPHPVVDLATKLFYANVSCPVGIEVVTPVLYELMSKYVVFANESASVSSDSFDQLVARPAATRCPVSFNEYQMHHIFLALNNVIGLRKRSGRQDLSSEKIRSDYLLNDDGSSVISDPVLVKKMELYLEHLNANKEGDGDSDFAVQCMELRSLLHASSLFINIVEVLILDGAEVISSTFNISRKDLVWLVMALVFALGYYNASGTGSESHSDQVQAVEGFYSSFVKNTQPYLED